MNQKATLGERLRYRFDNFMARGGSSIFISLVVVFVTLLSTFAALRAVVLAVTPKPDATATVNADGTPAKRLQFEGGVLRQTYITFLQMTDPGNMNHDVESRAMFKVSAIFAGLSGVVMLSMLIAFITTTLDQKIMALKKGHSRVIEEGHTLILGWNERVAEILRELMLANESERDACAVILSSQDKEVMDDYLALQIPDSGTTRIVTRSGNESSLLNLQITSVSTSKSVIILASCNVSATEDEKATSDALAIKTVLAVIASRPSDQPLSVVVELFFDRNRSVVESISPDEITTINANEILAKILVQTSRSVGLSLVYNEILSFDGCEMYFHQANWNGIAWSELGFHFADGVPLGIRHADGQLRINPPLDTMLADDDDILIVAEDDSTIEFQPQPVVAANTFPVVEGKLQARVEQELIIGWSPKCETILREYAEYTLPGSRVDIMLRTPAESIRSRIEAIDEQLPGLDVRLIEADPLDADDLNACEPFKYDNIIILSQGGTEEVDAERTDSETIIILLLLRRIFADHPAESASTKLITEVLDSANQALVARTGVNDFIISNRVVSMLLAQISEDPDIARVYDDLFQEDGAEIYLKPLHLYFSQFPVKATFAELMRVAQNRDEICFGVKLKALETDQEQNCGVKLIPPKDATYTLTREDCLVVLAEDDT